MIHDDTKRKEQESAEAISGLKMVEAAKNGSQMLISVNFLK